MWASVGGVETHHRMPRLIDARQVLNGEVENPFAFRLNPNFDPVTVCKPLRPAIVARHAATLNGSGQVDPVPAHLRHDPLAGRLVRLDEGQAQAPDAKAQAVEGVLNRDGVA